MICKHSFFKASDISKPLPGAVGWNTGVVGVEVVCVNCGQARKAWVDGTVEIVFEGNKPIEEDHVDSSRP